MRSESVARRWLVASAMSLLVGCGPEVLEEKHTQDPVTSSEQEMVGGTSTTLSGNCGVQPTGNSYSVRTPMCTGMSLFTVPDVSIGRR